LDRKAVGLLEKEFVDTNSSVNRWLMEKAKKSEQTARQYCNRLFHYWLWLRENKNIADMEGLLEDYKRLRREGEDYRHIDLVKEYLFSAKMVVYSLSYRNQSLSAIRSFYRYNRCALPQEKLDLTVTEIENQRAREKLALKPMTLQDVKLLISPMKVKEKAIMLILLQSGMGIGEFINQFNVCNCRKEWLRNNGHVCEPAKIMKQLNQGAQTIKIEFVGRKNNHNSYFSFIGRDAIDALKKYLVYRSTLIRDAQERVREFEKKERGGKLGKNEKRSLLNYRKNVHLLTSEWREGEPLFISNWLNPIQDHNIQEPIRRYKRSMGLNDRQFSPHTFRDIFKTECAHAGVDNSISEFFIGHTLDPLGYNKLDRMYPEDFNREYLKVEPSLNIISHKGMEIEKEELQKMKKENVDLRERVETLTKVVMALAKENPVPEQQIRRLMEAEEEPYPKATLHTK